MNANKTTSLSELSRAECISLLQESVMGRIGMSVDALPAVLPVLISFMDGAIVFRTVPGTKLALASDHAVVAVEVDDFDPEEEQGWSVLVRGVAEEMTDPGQCARAARLLPRTWILDGSADHYVSVSADLVTGRRLH